MTTVSGLVSTGLGKGARFVSMPAYAKRFREKLGYAPFAGTFNVLVDDQYAAMLETARAGMPELVPELHDGKKTWGAVLGKPGVLETPSGAREPVTIIHPVRTRHAKNVVELLHADDLRAKLSLKDGDRVKVEF